MATPRDCISSYIAGRRRLLIGTVAAPGIWSDPLGPYTKIIPVLIATAFTLAILDDR
ncbi:MAG: hypothetical protein K2Y71_08545 [Xanthobacteraceae bacterium]|nr:hypothetical protein [Xanthobacteraceae bacterium]